MKYLIISKGPSFLHGAKKENLLKSKEVLQKAMDSGKVEACYGLVAGGTVWVINADSHGALARGLRAYNLASAHEVEVYPIVDGLDALDAHHKHAQAQ
jgi:TPR repeat protein